AASVVHAMMAGHRPQVWLSDRYSAQQGHADAQQTCLAHLARDVAYACEASEDDVPWRLELWLGSVFDLARGITTFASSTIARKRRALEGRPCGNPDGLWRAISRASSAVFTAFPGAVDVTNNGSERDLRP